MGVGVMGSTVMPMMKKPGNETIIASAGGRESEHRGGAVRGHLGTSGDIWGPFRGQVGGASGSYNLQTISTDFLGTFCIILRPFWKHIGGKSDYLAELFVAFYREIYPYGRSLNLN